MRSAIERVVSRLRRASRWPGMADWFATGVAFAAFGVVALPLAWGAGLVGPPADFTAASFLPLVLRVLLLPALIEEVLFRAMPNPHPEEEVGSGDLWLAGALSLGAYVLAHPLAHLLSPTPTPFTRPAFLLLTALLGVTCLLLYRRSGSLWPPVALHWLTVSGWLALGGRGVLPAP